MYKSALTDEQKAIFRKYRNAGIGAGVLAAGLGLFASNMKSKKDRASKKPEDLKNAIIVDILKNRFMADVPTPESQREMVGGAVPLLGMSDAPEMSPEDIAAKKKDIVKANGRKFNFFGKVAEDEDSGDKEETKKDPPDPKSSNAGSDNDDNAPKLPRDENGRFVSPTSPIAVKPLKKEAKDDGNGFRWLDSLWNLVAHPVETGKGVGMAAIVRPAAIASGAVGSIYLSKMIVDKVNEIRARSAKRREEEARKEYVRLLQGSNESEKDAGADNRYSDSVNPLSAAAAVGGTAFIVPAVLTAMIVNRVMEKRKKKEEKDKDRSSSYPEDPIILYKTSEDNTYKTSKDNTIKLSPESALVSFLIEQSMIDSIPDNIKKADSLPDKFVSWVRDTASGIKNKANEYYETAKSYYKDPYGTAADNVINLMSDPKNDALVKNLADAHLDHNNTMLNDTIDVFSKQLKLPDAALAAIDKDELKRRIASNKKMRDMLIGKVNSDKWKEWREGRVYKYLADSRLFGEGSDMFNLVKWIINNLGIAKLYARYKIGNILNNMSRHPQAQQPQSQAAAQ